MSDQPNPDVTRRRQLHPEVNWDYPDAGLRLNQEQLDRDRWTARNRACPRYDSPLCVCGARRSWHAEDGSYDLNGCPLFTPTS